MKPRETWSKPALSASLTHSAATAPLSGSTTAPICCDNLPRSQVALFPDETRSGGTSMGIFGSRSFDCAVQGCQATTQQPFKEGHTANWDFFQGKCATHGKWAVCRTHGYPYIKSGTGWYKHIWGDWNQVQKREICPVCWWETPEGRDRAEAQRRNAERERLEQEFLAEREAAFRSQGYDSEA